MPSGGSAERLDRRSCRTHVLVVEVDLVHLWLQVRVQQQHNSLNPAFASVWDLVHVRADRPRLVDRELFLCSKVVESDAYAEHRRLHQESERLCRVRLRHVGGRNERAV
ncbi:MAG: hypothetical protein ACK55I_27460, partial [bacterium]